MAVDDDVPWDLVSKVRRAPRKTQIVYQLDMEPASASELGKEMGIQTASAANHLRDLKQMEPPVVACITPDQPHHRLYALTEEGKVVREHV